VLLMAIPLLILFTESLDVRFAVRIEEFLAALLPRRFEFGRCDVPVRPAFFGNGAQILTEIFHGGPTEEPIAVVDIINDKTHITTDLREAIMHAFEKVGGEDYLVTVARKNPAVFCALLARILPLQLTAQRDGAESPSSKIAEALELLRNRLGAPQIQYLGERRQAENPPPN
jgi:hypothetical protein